MHTTYTVYILRCSDNSYYVGSTSDIKKRIVAHNKGNASKWTSLRRPVQLIYTEELSSLVLATRREKQIKKWTRSKKENLIRDIWQ